jgi:hypothetical protein
MLGEHSCTVALGNISTGHIPKREGTLASEMALRLRPLVRDAPWMPLTLRQYSHIQVVSAELNLPASSPEIRKTTKVDPSQSRQIGVRKDLQLASAIQIMSKRLLDNDPASSGRFLRAISRTPSIVSRSSRSSLSLRVHFNLTTNL